MFATACAANAASQPQLEHMYPVPRNTKIECCYLQHAACIRVGVPYIFTDKGFKFELHLLEIIQYANPASLSPTTIRGSLIDRARINIPDLVRNICFPSLANVSHLVVVDGLPVARQREPRKRIANFNHKLLRYVLQSPYARIKGPAYTTNNISGNNFDLTDLLPIMQGLHNDIVLILVYEYT
ncbi:hypothetical protein E4T38_04134 [Aureobasidium subglaciale]|nr:hypothetical protein E4T38_04134 [Aureobasidium subglaciale]KAI5224547.1 hypothetical protein E4T40_04055 [Aureobasidium subglaciale]KAI5227805.1 hypothetical protein E4T41_04275 [Aureobasidium subglaciale]KAI5263213.1 hypothetical protein E4T46_03896 [Aureobasidium subglaciale]